MKNHFCKTETIRGFIFHSWKFHFSWFTFELQFGRNRIQNALKILIAEATECIHFIISGVQWCFDRGGMIEYGNIWLKSKNKYKSYEFLGNQTCYRLWSLTTNWLKQNQQRDARGIEAVWEVLLKVRVWCGTLENLRDWWDQAGVLFLAHDNISPSIFLFNLFLPLSLSLFINSLFSSSPPHFLLNLYIWCSFFFFFHKYLRIYKNLHIMYLLLFFVYYVLNGYTYLVICI